MFAVKTQSFFFFGITLRQVEIWIEKNPVQLKFVCKEKIRYSGISPEVKLKADVNISS